MTTLEKHVKRPGADKMGRKEADRSTLPHARKGQTEKPAKKMDYSSEGAHGVKHEDCY